MAKLISNAADGTFVETEAGARLVGVTRIRFDAAAGDIATIEVELWSGSVEALGALRVLVAHPVEGTPRQVESINFADGTTWRAE